MNRPELLVPAGDLEKLKIGLLYGADAFYLGLPSFSMRSRTNNFDKESILEGIELIRKAGKKFYLTTNIYPRGNKVDAFIKHIKFVREKLNPDALIVADPGVLEIIKEYYPEANIHISVQANVLNYRSADFWCKQGASRIILPRELMLSEIKEIHEKVKGLELEFFVHGAICVAYSGRCLMSLYMTGRDANQGICAHCCRWKYKLNNEVALEEEMRPNEFFPIDEDEHGSYIMNSKDMCLLPYLKDLFDAGICSFKIEGRNKTEYYLATIVKAYRKAIDDMMAGKRFDESLMDEVKKSSNRGFIPGFLFGFPGNDSVSYDKSSPIQTHKFVGIVKKIKAWGKADLYEVEARNRLECGQEVEIMTPKDCFMVKVSEMFDLDGSSLDVIHGGIGNRIIKLVPDLSVYSMIRLKVRA